MHPSPCRYVGSDRTFKVHLAGSQSKHRPGIKHTIGVSSILCEKVDAAVPAGTA
ncbi:hypothetical protein FA13DRAFT_1742145 [Coprinellus micaceus]|uniref:Uncharacterized protein n=1 Tax=Coprinellus micaceus TaxID=71717 RepID=A0A4Y7SI14_COPMI|nr:hypothetical protein FA13DRAFT_1742145 [Coprinellus micaceus]